MSSTAIIHQIFAVRPRSRALLDVAVAAAALAGTLALIWHGGVAPNPAESARLDAMASCSRRARRCR